MVMGGEGGRSNDNNCLHSEVTCYRDDEEARYLEHFHTQLVIFRYHGSLAIKLLILFTSLCITSQAHSKDYRWRAMIKQQK